MERIHERTVQKDLKELDYYDDVVSHPETDILKSKVKQALGSTAVNTASRCGGIPIELFKTLKDDANKVFHSMSANLEDPAAATGLEKVNPHSSFQEGQY